VSRKFAKIARSFDARAEFALFARTLSTNRDKGKLIFKYFISMAQARIAGVNIPSEKKVKISLSYIYGIGPARSMDILSEAKIDPEKRVKDLSETEINKIREIVEKRYLVEGDLRREIVGNIKRLKEIGAYRGIRHAKGLPVRGQTTKRNSRTVRGNVRRTASSGRKPAAQKT